MHPNKDIALSRCLDVSYWVSVHLQQSRHLFEIGRKEVKEREKEKGKGEREEKDIRADKSRPRATFPFFFPFLLSTAHHGRPSAMTTRFHDVPLLRRRAPRRRLAAFALHV